MNSFQDIDQALLEKSEAQKSIFFKQCFVSFLNYRLSFNFFTLSILPCVLKDLQNQIQVKEFYLVLF